MLLPSTGITAAAESYSDKGVAPPDQGHHFLHIDDFSTDELRAMLASAAKVGVNAEPAETFECEAMDPFASAEPDQTCACNTAAAPACCTPHRLRRSSGSATRASSRSLERPWP